jgi:protein SCO1/2
MRPYSRAAFVMFVLLSLLPAAACAELQHVFQDVGMDQNIGAEIPTSGRFRDADGRTVSLGSYLGSRPAIVVLDYYNCPNLCGVTLRGLVQALKNLRLRPGRDFEVISISIDPSEGPKDARRKKDELLAEYAHPDTAGGWHFLTGDRQSIKAVAEALGYRYRYDPELKQYAHAAGIIIANSAGRAARYFFGVRFEPQDLRLGLVEAGQGKVGEVVDQLLLLCYQYDPATGRYGFAILNSIRALAALTVLVIGVSLWRMTRRDRSRRAQ